MSATPSRSPYDPFAEVFSHCMAEDFLHRTWSAIERLLIRRLPPQAHVLDLCCGSGQMARALAERGIRVTGLDASIRMLQLARKNAPLADFMLADVRSFSLPCVFQGALCTFNSLAHLDTIDDLRSAFRNVRTALPERSPFVFDLSMEEAYTTRWRGVFCLGGDSYACTVEPTYDAERRLGRNQVTMVHQNQRTCFCIEQHCHDEQDLRAALAAAGFLTVETFDAQRDLGIPGERGRCYFRCT